MAVRIVQLIEYFNMQEELGVVSGGKIKRNNANVKVGSNNDKKK